MNVFSCEFRQLSLVLSALDYRSERRSRTTLAITSTRKVCGGVKLALVEAT